MGLTPERRCFDTASTIAAIDRICALWLSHEDALNRLDAAAGDGGLGVTVHKGCTAVRLLLPSLGAESPATAIVRAGMAFNSAAASTMGALIATACMRMGKAAEGKGCLARDDLLRMVAAAEAGIRTRGKASLGDKTLLEALIPAVQALADRAGDAEAADADLAGAMLAAAEAGLQSTTGMVPKKGRAQWVGERAAQVPDAGASMVVWLCAALLNGD